jgi:molybdopterin-guanine dinucleotide biosynthesis protein A
MVPDVYPEGGSLGGIYTGLKAASGDAVFTVACDMPFLRREVVQLVVERASLADVVIPRVGEQYETLHAAYQKTCLPVMEERLLKGQLKIVGFFDRVRVAVIDEAEVARYGDPAMVFMNVNTPEELARAQTLAGEGGA